MQRLLHPFRRQSTQGIPRVRLSAFVVGALSVGALGLVGCSANPDEVLPREVPFSKPNVTVDMRGTGNRDLPAGHVRPGGALDGSSRKPDLKTLPSPLPIVVVKKPTVQHLDFGGCADVDSDGVCDPDDNCLDAFNPSQADADSNGVGDACDPTCKKVIDNADSWIAPNAFNLNYGQDDPMEVGQGSRTLIRFNVQTIPGNATLVGATLTLTDKNNGTVAQANLQVFGLNSAFNENTVTEGNFGGVAGLLGSGLSAPCSALAAPPHPIACYGHYDVSLGGLVGSPLSAIRKGIAVTSLDLPKLIRSREHVDDHPALELCYVVPDPTCTDGVTDGQEAGLDCGGPTCDPCVDLCSDGVQNSDEAGVDCGGTFCGPCGQGYAEAFLDSGNAPVAFVFVPAGTTFNSDADYDDYCNSKGFSGNRTGDFALGQTDPGIYDPSSYYCSEYCCFLGSGNGMASSITGFVNFGLPTDVGLQVIDRGCGRWCTGTFTGDVNTTDTLTITGANGYSYDTNALGPENYCQQKAVTLTQDGVVVCQAPNLCTGVVCAAPGPCQEAGVCNSINGACDYAPSADLTSCSDGDPSHSICLSGACSADPCTNVSCAALDQCHLPGVCNQLTGQCSNPPAPYGTVCDDGDPDTTGEICFGGQCGVAPPSQYATATLSGGNAPVAFVFVPAGIEFNSDADYDAYCESKGFSGNRTGNFELGQTAPGYYDGDSYYCQNYCCFLGFGNGMADSLSSFVNVSLPEGENLQVIDRGCGHWCTGTFNGDVNTTDGLLVSGVNSYQYLPGGVLGGTNYCEPGKQVITAVNGVVVCQAPNLCTGVVCNNPGTCQTGGSCNPVTGQCIYQPTADLTACNDGDPAHSICLAGQCAADPCIGVTCGGAIDQCHTAQVCDQHTGQCVNPNIANGTPCDDGDPNTATTSCFSGVCSASPCAGAGLQTLVIDGNFFCYTDMPGTCQDAHQLCEGLGLGYRLMCGDDWQPGRSGEGCGNSGAFTAYDIVNQYFNGAIAIGGFSAGEYNCVNNCGGGNCTGDCGYSPNDNQDGHYAFCAQKNFYTLADGPSFTNICGN